MTEAFNEDYYERGVEKKISGYTNYRYMPTRSYEEAATLLSRWDNEVFDSLNDSLVSKYVPATVLDFGCGKGYLVHALRQLGFNAFGQDISLYATSKGVAHPRVELYVSHPDLYDQLDQEPDFKKGFDYVICKDVMEHVPEEEVLSTLKRLRELTKKEALFVIPLGDNDQFRIREYEIDITHVTKKDEDWWIDKLKEAGFRIVSFKYKFGDIKKKWQEYEHGNGFFFVEPLSKDE